MVSDPSGKEISRFQERKNDTRFLVFDFSKSWSHVASIKEISHIHFNDPLRQELHQLLVDKGKMTPRQNLRFERCIFVGVQINTN